MVVTIATFLENTEDSVVHKKCENQLSTMFANLPESDPLVQEVFGKVVSSVESINPKLRMRSLTLLSIFIQTLSVTKTVSLACRLLADPDPRIRERTIFLLLTKAPDHQPERLRTRFQRAIRRILKDSEVIMMLGGGERGGN